MSYMFYNDTSAFYRTYCDTLDNFKLREKRFLYFETPNRALITHEYDIKLEGPFDYSKFYYLFNPMERLSWLKISQEGKRLSVAGSNSVKDIVNKLLIGELSAIHKNANEKFEELWGKKKGLPCFIKLEDIDCKNFLLSASYYDSIQRCEERMKNIVQSIFCPLSERRIKYEYFPLYAKSSWLYIKAPNNFNIKLHDYPSFKGENNNIDYANSNNSEADPEKLSLTIINKKSTTTQEDTVGFWFDIVVPPSLKTWFIAIYYISLITLGVLLGYFINMAYVSIFNPIWSNDPLHNLILAESFGGFVLAIIASVIATRGWLISEETILKSYSINLTWIMIFIVIFYIITLLL